MKMSRRNRDGVSRGSSNQACDYNSRSAPAPEQHFELGSSVYSFIGAGVTNTITGAAEYGFIGGGHSTR